MGKRSVDAEAKKVKKANEKGKKTSDGEPAPKKRRKEKNETGGQAGSSAGAGTSKKAQLEFALKEAQERMRQVEKELEATQARQTLAKPSQVGCQQANRRQ